MAAKKLSRECFKKNRVVQQPHVAKKHRKVPLSSGNMKGMERQEDESQGVRGRNQADVGREMSGGGVGGGRRRGGIDGMGQVRERQ